MTSFDDIVPLLADSTVAGPVDDGGIRNAESQLGLRFPPSYRLFLSRYGAAFCVGFEIAGLFDVGDSKAEPPLWSHVVRETLQRRKVSGELIPRGYVSIANDGGDYAFYLDTTRINPAHECPVVVLGPGRDGVVVADDFFEFLVRLSQGRLVF